eukprot:6211765-Pleurochrysis_carterae.AAC.2
MSTNCQYLIHGALSIESQHVVLPFDCPDDTVYLRITAMWCSCISESLLSKQFAATTDASPRADTVIG